MRLKALIPISSEPIKYVFGFLLTVSISFSCYAEENPNVWIDIPIVDLPFNSNGGYYPMLFSMRQSSQLSNSYYQNFHYLIAGSTDSKKTLLELFYLSAFDLVGSTAPLSSSWLHEEWHRSVLTRRGYRSFNDINTFPIGKSLIAVSHVDDQDLTDLKRYHHAEQVRLSSAGMESQVHQNLDLEENLFFKNSRSEDRPLIWLNTFNVAGYLNLCSSTNADSSTDTQNRDDGADIMKRDFTGLDCTAWAYDLFRPDEPYTARGTHPSGVGINRYIKYSDLSSKEKDFLKRQAQYSLLNFADPFLIGINGFSGHWLGKDVQWNFKLNHFLTSFGATIDANLFLKVEDRQYLAILHNGMTDTRYLPGFTIKQVELPINYKWFITPALTLWLQPQDQRIENRTDEALIDVSSEFIYKSSYWVTYYFGLEAKNKGWISGNVYLDDNFSAWTGTRISTF